MRFGSIFAWVLLVSGLLYAQDKTKKLNAGQTVGKAAKETLKAKSYHVEMTVQGAQQNASFSGTVKGNAAAVAGAAEVYVKGIKTLIKRGDEYVEPKEIDFQNGGDERAGLLFRSPAIHLTEIQQAWKTASYQSDESVGETECRVVTVSLSRQQKEKAIRTLIEEVKLPIPIPDPMQLIDVDSSEASYTVWIGKEDLRIRKYEFFLKPELAPGLPIPGGGGGPGMNFETRTTAEFSKFEEDLPWDIPKEVKRRLGIR